MDFGQYKYEFELISSDLTDFEEKIARLEQIRYIEDPKRFFTETAYQKRVDGNLTYYSLFSRIKSNHFNRGSGYLTHGFGFYRGSFHGQMIRGLINCCNLKQDSTILDPFCGSGTTLVEASLLGFSSIGIDINPIACLNSKVKTDLLDYNINHLTKDNNKYFNLSFFDDYIDNLTDFKKNIIGDVKDLFYLFIFLRALSTEFRFSVDRETNFKRIYKRYVNTLKLYNDFKKKNDILLGKSSIFFSDCLMELKKIRTDSIDTIITSPPYIDMIDYIQEDLIPIKHLFKKKEIEFLKAKSIGNKFKNLLITERLYWKRINIFLQESFRILKPDKYLIIIINNYKNMKETYEKLIFTNNFYIEMILKREVINVKKKDNKEFVYFLKAKK